MEKLFVVAVTRRRKFKRVEQTDSIDKLAFSLTSKADFFEEWLVFLDGGKFTGQLIKRLSFERGKLDGQNSSV